MQKEDITISKDSEGKYAIHPDSKIVRNIHEKRDAGNINLINFKMRNKIHNKAQ